MSRTRNVMVNAEVDLSDFDESDLIEYLEDNGYFVSKTGECAAPDAERVYVAMKCGQRNWIDLAREFVLASVGRISV